MDSSKMIDTVIRLVSIDNSSWGFKDYVFLVIGILSIVATIYITKYYTDISKKDLDSQIIKLKSLNDERKNSVLSAIHSLNQGRERIWQKSRILCEKFENSETITQGVEIINREIGDISGTTAIMGNILEQLQEYVKKFEVTDVAYDSKKDK